MVALRENRKKPVLGKRSFNDRLREIDLFFQKKDRVHQTMRRTAKRLERARISYAVVGGLALNAHGYERTTKDVDLLLSRNSFETFCRKFVGKNYDRISGRPRRFVDRSNGVRIDILVTGLFPGTGKPGPIAFPDPKLVREKIEEYQVVNLPTLVELKLAARRWRDFADIVEIIRANNLDESFLEQLHPSVHQDFVKCLEEKRREDEYEARQE